MSITYEVQNYKTFRKYPLQNPFLLVFQKHCRQTALISLFSSYERLKNGGIIKSGIITILENTLVGASNCS